MAGQEEAKAAKPILDESPKNAQVVGRVIAIATTNDRELLIEEDDQMSWIAFKRPELKTLLTWLGPDPLDGRRKVLVNTDSLGQAADVTVYAGEVY